MLPLLPMTELDAVNFMLETIGEAPINTLEVSGVSEVSIARTQLHIVNRSFQARGWFFNTETDYPLSLDADSKIPLPANVLKLDTRDRALSIIPRDAFLYDLKNHTYTFTSAPKVEITFFLPFEQLPQAVRDYITIVAARNFQRKVLGSDGLNGMSSEEENKALLAVMEMEADQADYSVFDSYSVARVINRYSNPAILSGVY